MMIVIATAIAIAMAVVVVVVVVVVGSSKSQPKKKLWMEILILSPAVEQFAAIALSQTEEGFIQDPSLRTGISPYQLGWST